MTNSLYGLMEDEITGTEVTGESDLVRRGSSTDQRGKVLPEWNLDWRNVR